MKTLQIERTLLAVIALLITMLVLSGCVTLSKCQNKYGLKTTVDTVITTRVDTLPPLILDVVDTVYLPGASVSTDVPVNTLFRVDSTGHGYEWIVQPEGGNVSATKKLSGGGKLTITAQIVDSILRLNCTADSLMKIIQQQEHTIRIKEHELQLITKQQAIVKTYSVLEAWWADLPLGLKWAIPIVLIIILFLVIRKIFKI